MTTSLANGKLWGAAAADWAAIQEPTCAPVYRATFDRVALAAGADYLDAGCGAGLALQLAAERGARVCGLDAAEALIAVARTRVPDADLRLGELEELPFAAASFDVVTGFNSFQYAANPVAALAEAKRVTRAGGKVVVMTWGDPRGMEAASLLAAVRPLLPAPPPGAPGPFALSDEAALRRFAETAGLQVTDFYDVHSPWLYPSLPVALRGLSSSGVAVRAIGNSSTTAVDEAHTEALAPFRQSDGSYRIGATFRCLVGQA